MKGRSIEEEIKIKAGQAKRLARYMSSTEDLVEEQILKAQQRGEFDNLSGAGQRLNLEENPFEPPELRMPFKILKDNGFAPYWIELGKEIDRDWEKFNQEVEHFKRYLAILLADKKPGQALWRRFNHKKEHFYFERKLDLECIRQKIIDYNLACPTFRAGRANIIVEDQMSKVKLSVESLLEELHFKIDE